MGEWKKECQGGGWVRREGMGGAKVNKKVANTKKGSGVGLKWINWRSIVEQFSLWRNLNRNEKQRKSISSHHIPFPCQLTHTRTPSHTYAVLQGARAEGVFLWQSENQISKSIYIIDSQTRGPRIAYLIRSKLINYEYLSAFQNGLIQMRLKSKIVTENAFH